MLGNSGCSFFGLDNKDQGGILRRHGGGKSSCSASCGCSPTSTGCGTSAGKDEGFARVTWHVGGLALRFAQFGFALMSLCIMVTISGFSSVTAFCFLVAAMVFQCLWSLCLGMLDSYALLTRRCLRNPLLVSLFVVGDWVTSTLTFAGACAAAGITVLIDNDLNQCGPNHCSRFEAAAAMAFMSWISITLSFFLSFWLLATR